MSISCEVVHQTTDRVRLRIPELKTLPHMAERIEAYLLDQTCVSKFKINAACASVTVWIDRSKGKLSLANLRRVSSKAPLHSPDDSVKASDATASTEAQELEDGKKALISSSVALGASLAFRSATWMVSPLVAFAGYPILKRAVQNLRDEKKITVDTLDAAALTTMLLQGSAFPAAFMTWLLALGDYIRDRTTQQSHAAISELMSYKKHRTHVLRDGHKKKVTAEELVVGDTVIVYPGDMILVDGTVISGKALVDQKSLTGESVPVAKKAKDKVFASTLISEGKLYIKAENIGESTRAAAIVKIVESAPKHETRIANFARRFADRVAAPTLIGAGAMYLATRDLNRAASLIILDFGTGMRVAGPTAAVSSIAYAAKRGILIKGGAQLEKMTQLDTFIFDKTGTLTQGNPEVTGVYRFNGFDEDQILALAASAEKRLTHPVSKAIRRAAKERGLEVPERDESEYKIGLGVKARVQGKTVHVGSARFFETVGIDYSSASNAIRAAEEEAQSPMFVAVDGNLVGMLTYSDPPRKESFEVVDALKQRGIRVVMLTGDSPAVAKSVARQLHIDEFVAEVFPEQKAEILQRYQQEGRVVGMIGDGINDSPALALSDVGVAVRNGAAVSREVADVVLLQDDLRLLIEAIDLSQDSMNLVRQDFEMIAVPNAIALVLALTGRLNPILATVVNNGSTVAAMFNSIRPLLRPGRALIGSSSSAPSGQTPERAPASEGEEGSHQDANEAFEGAAGEKTGKVLQNLFPSRRAQLPKNLLRVKA